MTPIYLDGHSSTPVAPEVVARMQGLWASQANPSAGHAAGAMAAAVVAHARTEIAALIGVDASEIVFTSDATEANNLAIQGVARANRAGDRREIVVSNVEHKSVSRAAESLRDEGFLVRACPVTAAGVADLAELRGMVGTRTLMVSIMAANNETGVVQPIDAITAIAHEAGALVHTDAAQLVGKLPFDAFGAEVDYVSLSAHKMYGPQGVGALYIAASADRPEPLLRGGGQEGGLRSGTLPVALIAGFGTAAARAATSMKSDAEHGRGLTESFLGHLNRLGVHHELICPGQHRLPGSLALRFPGVNALALTDMLASRVAFSSGSACNQGQMEPSHVWLALGISHEAAAECVRLFFSPFNDEREVAAAASHIADACRRIRLATGGGPQ